MSTADAPGGNARPEAAVQGADPILPADALEGQAARIGRQLWGLATLFGLYYFIQGIGEPSAGLLAQPIQKLLQTWGHDSDTIGLFMGILSAPWWFKPLYGLLSDFVPLAGYRRKGYLLLTSGAAAAAFLVLYATPLESAHVWKLFSWLLLSSLGIAFTDVVIDALMVEKGQPLGLTGYFQSIQWGCLWGASILSGYAGGYLSEHNAIQLGFMICGVATVGGLLLTIAFVTEKRRRISPQQLAGTLQQLSRAVRTPAVLGVAAFLFLWNFNPFLTTVQQLYMTGPLGFDDQFFGTTNSVGSAGAMVGSLAYALYCRRVGRRMLIHVSIGMGVLSTAAYWAMYDKPSALVISLVWGLATGTAYMIQFDLAAQACPVATAGTVFALLMAVSNLGVSVSQMLGGWLYRIWSDRWDAHLAFNGLIGVGVAFTAGCWLLVPYLTHALPHSPVEEA